MKIELFTLCDGAYNYNGKLTVVGALTTLNPEAIPCRIKLGLAMRIQVDSKDEGEKVMTVSFMNPDGDKLPVDLTVNLDVKPASEPVSYITFAAELQGFPLEQEGSHRVLIAIDGEPMATYSYNVKKRME